MKKRTVFDTNIWISYIINAKTDELVAMITKNEVLFLRSSSAIIELKGVLSRKKFEKYHFNIETIIDFYTDITEFCQTKSLFNACSDPNDNFLFDLAIQGNANYLVSGDKHVRNTPIKNKTVKIRTLTAFKEEIR